MRDAVSRMPAEEIAADRVAAVRDDPAGRLRLAAHFYRCAAHPYHAPS